MATQFNASLVLSFIIKVVFVLFDSSAGVVTTKRNKNELDPVGSTVRYEMRKLCTGSV